MSNVKNLKLSRKPRWNLLQIKGNTTFAQTFRNIKNDKQIDVVWVKKPSAPQMSAVLLHKLAGRKFRWVQNFENPPVPNLWSKILISQADRILVHSRKELNKLTSYGIRPIKIRIEK